MRAKVEVLKHDHNPLSIISSGGISECYYISPGIGLIVVGLPTSGHADLTDHRHRCTPMAS